MVVSLFILKVSCVLVMLNFIFLVFFNFLVILFFIFKGKIGCFFGFLFFLIVLEIWLLIVDFGILNIFVVFLLDILLDLIVLIVVCSVLGLY